METTTMHTLGRTGVALLALLLCIAPSAYAGPPETGDLIVVDVNGRFGGPVSLPAGGRVLKVDPTTGVPSIISSGDLLDAPTGVAIDAHGDIIVTDQWDKQVIKVNPADGSQTIISSGGIFDTIRDLVIDAGGKFLVVDAYYGGMGGIIKVDPVTGVQSVAATGGYIKYPSDVTLDAAGNMYVSGSGVGTGASVVKIDATTGVQTLISPGSLPCWVGGILVTDTGRIFLTELYYFNGLFEVDPATGAQTVQTYGFPFQDPYAMDVDSWGNFVVADSNWFGPGSIITVDPATWAKTTLSYGGLLVDPWDIEVMPELVIEVEIDVKPGSDPNAINPKSKGVIPVAILTTSTFDATDVDPESVEFGPDGALMGCKKAHLEDVDGDGDTDLLLHFRTQETGIVSSDTEVSLSGTTYDGRDITGTDLITTVGGGK